MNLSKEDSLKILIDDKKETSINARYKFSTKTEWRCLKCGTTTYISYNQHGRYAAFCSRCYITFNKRPSLAQFYYMMKLKTIQLNLIESQIYVNEFIK